MAHQCIELSLCYRNNWVYERVLEGASKTQPKRQRIGTNEDSLYTQLAQRLQQGYQLTQVIEVSQLNTRESSPYRLYYLSKIIEEIA